jgi:hypothetical protein
MEMVMIISLRLQGWVFLLGIILAQPMVLAQSSVYDRELLEATARVFTHAAMASDEDIGLLLRQEDDLARFIEGFLKIIFTKGNIGLESYADNRERLRSMIAELNLPESVSRFRIAQAKDDGDFSVVKVKLMAEDETLVVRLALNTIRKTIISIERVS